MWLKFFPLPFSVSKRNGPSYNALIGIDSISPGHLSTGKRDQHQMRKTAQKEHEHERQ